MATAPNAAVPPSSDPPLKRAVTKNMLLLFIVGDILGGGIYALAGQVGLEVGGAIWLPMLIALVLAGFTAASYAELVTKFPQAAGAALYTNRAFGIPFLTFMVAFAVMCSGIASAATLSIAFAKNYFGELVGAVPALVVVLVFFLVVMAINIRGIKESVGANAVLSVIEVGGLILVIIIGFVALGAGDGDIGRAFEVQAGGIDGGEALIPALLASTALAFYAVIGFEDSVNIAEEAENPGRDYPRALFLGLGIAGLLYVVLGILAPAVVPPATLLATDGAGELENTALIELAQLGPIGVDEKVFTIIGLFALANGALINMIMASRLTYGMSREGIVPSVFSRVLRGRQTPLNAILFTTGLALILATVGTLRSGGLGDLGGTTATLLLIVFAIVNVAVLKLRSRPVSHDHFVTPSMLPAVGAVASASLAIYTLVTKPVQLGFVAGLLGLGVIFWLANVVAKNNADGDGPGRFDTQAIQRIENPGDDRS
jgi:amino acid transporter